MKKIVDKIEHIEKELCGKFIRTSAGKQVFEVPSIELAFRAVREIGAQPFNFLYWDLSTHKFEKGRRPLVTI